MKSAMDERESFSTRLQQSLRNAHYPADSPTQLARNFNLRFSGAPVTVHAVRKWLCGEAIPTQDKMRALADWLMVPVEWLRYGTGREEDDRAERSNVVQIPSLELRLLASMQRLDEHHRQIVREFIDALIKLNRRAEKEQEWAEK